MDGSRIYLMGPENLHREMGQFFEHLGRWKRPLFFFEKAWKPQCDVSETEDDVIVVADLGGIAVENIEIRVEGNVLILKGVRPEPPNDPRRHYRQMEISYGPFERAIELPARIDEERAKASYDEGFLEIKLPKATPGPRKEVDVDVSTE